MRRHPHKIRKEDLLAFKPEIRLAGSHGQHENKSLDMVVHPATKEIHFVVKSFKKEVATVDTLDEAIDAYNNIQSDFTDWWKNE